MATVQHSVVIDRSVEEVFDFWAHPENARLWREDLIGHEQLPSGRVDVGTKWVERQRFGGREQTSSVTVTVFDPPSRMDLESRVGPVKLEGTATFEPSGDGTLLTQWLEFRGGLLKPLENRIMKSVQAGIQRDLDRLKAVLEQGT